MGQTSKILAVRISTTQALLLKQPKYKDKQSAIVRALLSLYLNGRLAMEAVERAIQMEIDSAAQRDNKTKSKI